MVMIDSMRAPHLILNVAVSHCCHPTPAETICGSVAILTFLATFFCYEIGSVYKMCEKWNRFVITKPRNDANTGLSPADDFHKLFWMWHKTLISVCFCVHLKCSLCWLSISRGRACRSGRFHINCPLEVKHPNELKLLQVTRQQGRQSPSNCLKLLFCHAGHIDACTHTCHVLGLNLCETWKECLTSRGIFFSGCNVFCVFIETTSNCKKFIRLTLLRQKAF